MTLELFEDPMDSSILEALEQRFDQLKNKLAATRDELANARQENEVLRGEIEKTRQERDQALAENSVLTSNLDDTTNAKNALSSELDALKLELIEAKRDLSAREEKQDNFRGKVQALLAKMEEM